MGKAKSTHGTCPECGHHDCFTEFEDGGFYCNSCGHKPKGRVEPKNKDTSEIDFQSKPYRGISKRVMDFTGTKVGVVDGKDYCVAYKYPHRAKFRVLPKDFGNSLNKGFTADKFFLQDKWNAGSSKVLTIVEGEDDVLAFLEMFDCKWPVISPPSGTLSKALLKENLEYLQSFESVVIATDNDATGERAALQLATILPNKCSRVNMTKHKDAMEYLENNVTKDFIYAWINRQKYVQPFDTNTPSQFKKMLDESRDDQYLPTGLADYDEKALGLFQGHVTTFKAQEGIGKTELVRMLEYNLARNYPDVPFAYCHLEEPEQRSLLGLVSYWLQKNVTRKDLIKDREEVDKAIDELMGRENIHQFKIGTDEDPEVLIDRIKYYANVCGCKYIFFEPIQDIASQRKAGVGLTEFLDQMAIKLSRTAAETGCGIVIIAHANENGDTRDSKQIQKQSSVVIELQRDMEATNERDANTTFLVLRKNRPVGTVGPAGSLYFDSASFTLQESV